MAVAELVVNIVSGVAQFQTGMKLVSKELNKFSNQFKNVGVAMAKFSAPVAALGAFGVKAFSDWDTALASLDKTLKDTSNGALQKFGTQITAMSEKMPMAAAEIAEVAAMAAQLGIKNDSLMKFTDTMVRLGVTTNLSANDAATALSRFINITGSSQGDIDRLAASVVHLGNNLATTEAEIVDMGLRLASAGNVAGLTDAEIMGLSGTLSSLGLQSDMGGTAMSKFMRNMVQAVSSGGESLAAFDAIVQHTGKSFKDIFQNEGGMAAIQATATGLNMVRDAGGNLGNALSSLGVKQALQIDAVTRLALGHKQLANAVNLGTTGYKENTALIIESNKRFNTFASQIKITWNLLTNVAREIGASLAPVILKLNEYLKVAVNLFRQIPMPIKATAVMIASLVTALGGMGMGLGVVLSGLATVAKVMSGAAAAGAIILAGKILLIVAALAAVATAAYEFRDELTNAFQHYVAIWMTIGDFTKKGVSVVFEAIANSKIASAVKRIGEEIVLVWDQAWKLMKDAVTSAMSFITEKVNKVFGWVAEKARWLNESTGGAFSELGAAFEHFVVDPITDGAAAVSDAYQKNVEALKQHGIQVNQTADEVVALTIEQAGAVETTDDLKDAYAKLGVVTGENNKLTAAQKKLIKEQTKARKEAEKAAKEEAKHIKEVAEALKEETEAREKSLEASVMSVANAITNSFSEGNSEIGDMIGNLLQVKEVSGSLMKIISRNSGDGGILGSLFGSGRPDGVEGPLLESGNFEPGMVDQVSIASIISGAMKLGNNTEDTFAGAGQISGAAIGAIWGPVGSSIGATIGEFAGKQLGSMFGGGTSDPGTIARNSILKNLNNLIDGKNFSIIDATGALVPFEQFNLSSQNMFNDANWPEKFQTMAGSATSAFTGVGMAIAKLSGESVEYGAQIGMMLAENLGGSLENLGRMITALNIPITDFEAALAESLKAGEIGIREYVVAIDGIRGAYKEAEKAAESVALATEWLVSTSGDTMEAVNAIKTLAQAAKKEGISSIKDLVDKMVASGRITVDKAQEFMNAMNAFGISSVEELANASDDTLAHVLAFLTSVAEDGGTNFFEMEKAAKQSFDSITEAAKRGANEVKKAYSGIKVDISGGSAPPVPSYNGNIFNGGKIKQFFRGGVFDRKSLFNIGSMAERGPEAILPLDRMPDGKLGVLASFSGANQGEAVVINVDARGAERGFESRVRDVISRYFDVKNNMISRKF